MPEGKRAVFLEFGGFRRRWELAHLKSLGDLYRAISSCRRHMRSDRPLLAVAFGGYAGVPGAVAALSLGIPLIIHEQNVIPGLANRLLAPLADTVAVSFAETLERFPRWGGKTVVTGNPLRHAESPQGDEGWRYFGLDRERRTVGVVGGSQGAASLNRAVLEAIPGWRERKDLQVVHSVGRDKYQEFEAEAAKVDTGVLLYRPMEYIERMDLLYDVADLMVCRAGASTISELGAAGCAAILVPFPHATAAHQDANAGVLERAGGGLVISDGELSGERLCAEVIRLLDNPEVLLGMGEASRSTGRPGAAEMLAEVVLARAREESHAC